MVFSGRNWFGTPKPITDESFLSWFSRTAAANTLTPRELYRIAVPGSQLFSYDLDRHAFPELLSSLEASTGVSVTDQLNMTFTRWSGRISDEIPGSSKRRWLSPAGLNGSKKSFGQQICPDCLREDDVPYFRVEWHLGFLTLCAEHRRYLVDRCPSCASPIQPLASGQPGSELSQCWNCGEGILSKSFVESVEGTEIETQAELIRILSQGWTNMGPFHLPYSIAFFEILDIVARLLSSGRYAVALRTHVVENLSVDASTLHIPRLKEVERFNPRCRSRVISMAWMLMQEWPHRFIDACTTAGIPGGTLQKKNRNLPFAFAEPVRSELSGAIDQATKDEVAAAATYLRGQKIKPTRKALIEILGKKFDANHDCVEPDRECLPYGTHRYWKLDGVSPDVRTAAKTAARLEGENVGAWVDKTLKRVLTENSTNNKM